MTSDLFESYRFCQRLSRREARNFYYSFLVLPPARRRSMCALYAFMRQTDDLADAPGEPLAKRSALTSWRHRLDQALTGEPGDWPGFPALAETVQRHQIPPSLLHAVIDGVEMDLEPRRFRTFEDLYPYCYRVASAVGLCCIHIWGFKSDGGRAESLAEACGVALQLTNIVRDVREDAIQGRIYIPIEDFERFGIDPERLQSTSLTPALRELLAFEAQRADEYYRQSLPLFRLVAPVGRPVLGAIVGIYRALLEEIARRDYDVWAQRVALPAWRKSAITLGALAGRVPPSMSTLRATTGGLASW